MDDTADLIIDRLYLGGISAAKNEKELELKNITRILSVMKKPLPGAVRNSRVCFNVDAIDSYKCDLLQWFPECLTFIEQNRQDGHNVLVHWYIYIFMSVFIYFHEKSSLLNL